jgi:cyclophilin family peptidyl-prolyl cis-trans isomerase/HEAT repeat protein
MQASARRPPCSGRERGTGSLRAALAAALFLASCGSGLPAGRPSATLALGEGAVEEAGTLLLLADRRMFEPFSVHRLAEGPAAVRSELALTLGRIGDPRGLPALEMLLQDGDPTVRRSAAFAMGFVGDAAALPTLLAATGDRDRATGRRAVEALARLEAPLERVEAALGPLAPEEREARLLPELFRFGAEELVARARRALRSSDPELRRWAAYALARKPRPEARDELRALLGDEEPWLRSWGARGLSRVGTSKDGADLAALLADPSPGPVIEALRALASLAAAGRTVPPSDSRARLLELFDDPLPGVRVTALEAAAAWLGDEVVSQALVERFAGGSGREREVALLALARGADRRALDLLGEAARAEDPQLRARAVEAAAELDALDRVANLAGDPEPVVRQALLSARLEGEEEGAAAAAALNDGDPAVRATALGWLAEHPSVPADEIVRAMDGPGAERLVDLRLSGVRALAALAAAHPAERHRLVDLLIELLRHPEWLVRREASRALEGLGEERAAIGAVDTGWSIAVYRQLAERTRDDRWVDLETRHGTLRLRLACSEAPLTCSSFTHLVAQGFYDGLPFHRVVPNFVVQAGDPRGDGAGGPGFTIRDEYNLASYERGVIGMALAGPDTAGSQFFITLSPQPHLDGTYTAFGRVESGDEVLDRIEQGDRILRMTEVPGAGG